MFGNCDLDSGCTKCAMTSRGYVALVVFFIALVANAAEPAMERLPPGSVRPQGWLMKQMELQRDGLTGHAEELYEDIGKSDWLTGEKRGGQFAWERGPYYAKGLTALAFALDDETLKARAKKWIDAYLASQRENGDFGPKDRNWWANMIVLWTLRDWCEATGDVRVVPFLERYFAFQRAAFAGGDSFAKDSPWAVARVGDELDVILWLYRKTGKSEWLDYARTVAAMSADWTDYYYNGGFGGWGPEGYRAHIVNFMQGLKTPPLKWLLGDSEADRTAFRAALAPDGWAMRKYGRPDRAVNGTEPLSSRSASQGTELCATAEHILSAQVALETLGDADIADDMEVAAYNTLPATLSPDGKGVRYYCLLNQPLCVNGDLNFRHNGKNYFCNVPGPYSGFGCCRSNFHFAWPKFAESMWMRRDGGLAAVAYGDCTVTCGGPGAERPVTIRATGGYPFSDAVRLEIVEAAGGEWPLFVRIPGWCKDASVKVNGSVCGERVLPGAFVRLSRKWQKGDVVDLSFPSKPVVTRWKDDSVAVMRGPLLYALRIDADEKECETEKWPLVKKDANGALRDRELGFPMRELRAKSPWNYALVTNDADGEPRFETKGDGLDRRLLVKAVRTGYAGWGTMRANAPARAEDPPPSPVPAYAATGDVETIELVPLAFTQLRITLFPWILRQSDISISWSRPIELGPGGYARVHRLSDGRLMAAYERRGDLMVRFCERGCLDTWTEPQCAARGFAVTNASGAVRVNLANAEFAQLATGRILLACNMRPAGKKAEVHPYAIAIAASDDAGVNWSPLKIVYKGRESADGIVRGCYEPFILPLSGGAAQMFYADETPYTEGRSKYQEISVIETTDGGETWGCPRTASYAPKRRDGMPVVLQMGEWRYLAIESNPARTRLHPQIIRSRVADNWREVVGAPSEDRFEPFREPRNWEEQYGGAPYIAATENYILLSWQECADRGEFATFRTAACVAAMPKAEIKDGRVTAMRGVSTPPKQDGVKMRWNALCPLGGDRFLLVSDVEGKIVLWPGRVCRDSK